MGQVYSEHAGPNGFLYITYASQEVFGCPRDGSAIKSKVGPAENFKDDIVQVCKNY